MGKILFWLFYAMLGEGELGFSLEVENVLS